MKDNKKLTWVLGIIVFAVWGMIARQVLNAVTTDDSIEAISRSPIESSDSVTVDRYAYADDVRDPFHYVPAPPTGREDTTHKNVAKSVPAWTPPPLKLSGILMNHSRRTAMVEASDGAVFFLHEGDTLRGMKLLKINDQRVSYFYQKKKDEWVFTR